MLKIYFCQGNFFFLKDLQPNPAYIYVFFAQIQIYIQDGMCRLEPARTGTLFSDGCWGLSPHITDCNQLQVSIFRSFHQCLWISPFLHIANLVH